MFKRSMMTLIVTLFALTSLYPLFWVVLQSLKTDVEFFGNQWSLPHRFIWQNYITAWEQASFATYYGNTLLVTLISLVGGVAVCVVAGYAFGKMKFFGKRTLQVTFALVLFVPSPVLLLPVFFINRDLGLLNTYPGMIGPYICSIVPMGVLLMQFSFAALPNELSESAKMDGCGEWRTFYRILLPLTMPTVATLSILQFIGVWSEYMWAFISNSSPKMYTIAVGMAQMASKKYVYGFGPVFAGMVITSIVVIAVYIFLQKYFVQALSEGAVKG
ncbi:sugar ABC transporter permease [Paenibacillus baekrokdamisoli]|uniref:Sugar ABC transporter permease n=1 Tax=Paenibacillus baekrokdamisoli TaxID=1712516 RepID=A0A3G9IYT3_9BACL|nr:carbohydrate ABC transporter permease [Paenibacillus baekrokdamisoli]MBB3071929.1 ABC-type glycerol-3-phosphate transport system permease component [Paenibacillus baekrokdamisoli]BBH24087.1 sugar ABC transporter permease [Paenibacillus baekrokdamisoli]